ncbi:hypothetical protein A5881_002667 [Enterococcus termitis]|nr:hypothetical protein A5881_002657 [Enterococcus termitis]
MVKSVAFSKKSFDVYNGGTVSVFTEIEKPVYERMVRRCPNFLPVYGLMEK